MPIHDWSRVPSGLYHDFHQTWTVRIASILNKGLLPRPLSALLERSRPEHSKVSGAPPQQIYAGRANRVAIKHHLGKTIAIIEIISPGNKDTRASVQDFLNKTIDFLRAGIHVLLIDLLPRPRDPLGIHQLIGDEIGSDTFAFPPGKDHILASYEASEEKVAYVQPLAVGEALPEVPLFLSAGQHVKVPLESTYQVAWRDCPEDMRIAVETGVMPDPDADIESRISLVAPTG